MLRAALLALAAVLLVGVAESSARLLILPTVKPKLVSHRLPRNAVSPNTTYTGSVDLLSVERGNSSRTVPSVNHTEPSSNHTVPVGNITEPSSDHTTPSGTTNTSDAHPAHHKRNVRSIFPDPIFPFPPRPTFPEPNPFPAPKGPFPVYVRDRRNILIPKPRGSILIHEDNDNTPKKDD